MKKIKLLIAEDDNALNDTLTEIFVLSGYEVFQAMNGQQALDALDSFYPNLIITDYHMPLIDGIRLTEMLMSNAIFSQIPVFFISADPLMDAKMLGLRMGAIDYIFKPFLVEELVLKVRNVLRAHDVCDATYTAPKIKSKHSLSFLSICNEYLEEHFHNLPNIDLMADALNLSRSTLDKKIKRYSGLSTSHYVLNFKLGKAHELIEEADLNITEIAKLAGFSSAAYFSTCFKQKYGVSPKKFLATRVKILNSYTQDQH